MIPAAGFATRLGPLQVSKEMLRVAGRPVMDHLWDRLQAAGCEEIRVVTRPEKRDVIVHARELGAGIIEASPATITDSVLTGMRGLDPDDVVALGFPDTIWEPLEGMRLLRAPLSAGADVALGVFRSMESYRSDVVELSPEGSVRRIIPKPLDPPSDQIWGCCAFRVRALEGIDPMAELGSHFDDLARSGAVVGVHLSDVYLDIGTQEAWGSIAGRDLLDVLAIAHYPGRLEGCDGGESRAD